MLVSAVMVMCIVIPVDFSWIWLAYGLAVMPAAMALATCTTWLSNQVSHKEQGQILGNNQALLVLGESSSAAVGGLIAAILIPLPIIVMGCILFLASYMVYKTPAEASIN